MNVDDRSKDDTPEHDMSIVPTIQVEDIDLEISHFTGTAISSDQAKIILAFIATKSTIVLELTDSIILGRGDDTMAPDMYADLTPYGAIDQGVSRRHAVLQRVKRTITISDLNSRNGTFLNGARLIPHQARFLRHGDEIHLGKLMFRIHFEKHQIDQLTA
jgi:hypothetical protein